MIRVLYPFLVLLFVLCSFAHAAEKVKVTGTVKQPKGEPIPEANITVEETGTTVSTDPEGEFTLYLPEGTYTVIVEAFGYEVYGQSLQTDNQTEVQLNVVLPPKHFQFEEIVYGASDTSGTSVSSPATQIQPEKQATPGSVLESVQDIAGVSPVGQGGLFQAPAIRGASRERILLMFEGVRVTSERRTGASFSFVDPLFLEGVSVTRGPAPVLYGSNGEAGLIQATALEPSETELKTTFRGGYQSNSSENWQVLTVKDGNQDFQYALGFARRSASDYEAGNGTVFPSGYTRYNLVGKARWLVGTGSFTFLILPTWTEDIEKSSIDFDTRPTLYPEERHQVYMVDWQNLFSQSGYDLHAQLWYHPNSLITRDDRVSSGQITERNEVFNETDDYGLRVRVGRTVIDTWRIYTGFDFFGRANVNARQQSFEQTASGFVPADDFYSIQDGTYRDIGLFLTTTGQIEKLIANAGLRIQRVSTSNHAGPSVSDAESSWSGNLGLSYPFTGNWEAILNVGRGIRPATISEKFFTGETGRGSVTGNPDLRTESNIEVDGGLRFRHADSFAGFYLFRNRIDDFIDRIRIEGDAFTFLNHPTVTIQGVELEGLYRLGQTRFFGNFHHIKGNDDENQEVNDIPPSRLLAGIEYEPESKKWSGSMEVVKLFEKDDPGPVENAIEGTFLVNLIGSYRLSPGITFRVSGSNLTDEAYFASADERAPYAPGRTFSLELILSR